MAVEGRSKCLKPRQLFDNYSRQWAFDVHFVFRLETFFLEDLEIFFPYPYLYPEQYEYMLNIKRALDAGGPVCIEMPTGTGKTVSLLSLITSYQLAKPQSGKLIYCCRTVGEMVKTIEELKVVIEYRDKELTSPPPVLALTLSSRRNLCIHPRVSQYQAREKVDGACRAITASWAREKAGEVCSFFEGFKDKFDVDALRGIYSLDDLKEFGALKKLCPYFVARKAVEAANIVVFSYQYVLQPRIAHKVIKSFGSETIIVFDEAHNIDDVCIEAFSIDVDKRITEASSRNIFDLYALVRKTKEEDVERLQNEYQRLLRGLDPNGGNNQRTATRDRIFETPEEEILDAMDIDGEPVPAVAPQRDVEPIVPQTADQLADELNGDPVLPEDVLREAMPAEIRQADEFLSEARKFLDFIRGRFQMQQVSVMVPASFLQNVLEATEIEPKTLRFFHSRLDSLLTTLQIAEVEKYGPFSMICDFASLAAAYNQGFKIIYEPYDERTPHIPDPILHFACLDAALAMRPIIKRFPRMVITSGTLSPLHMIPRIMNFTPVVSKSLTTTLYRQSTPNPKSVVSRGSDQTMLSTKFQEREDMDIIRNYGLLLLRLCEVVPDGIVAFFVSYQYMEAIVSIWNNMGLINQILKHKLVFVETADIAETSIALDNFKLACDSGRGAVFLSVARGKVSEGIDFANHYGRAVVLFGIPYVYTESRILKSRLEYLRENYQIKEGDFLTFDAMRAAAQCLGRVIRGKTDYGVMVLADRRYARVDKRTKLPQWIQQYLAPSELNLSTEGAAHLTSTFLREMAQPIEKSAQIGISLWTQRDVENQPASRRGAARRAQLASTPTIPSTSTEPVEGAATVQGTPMVISSADQLPHPVNQFIKPEPKR